MSETTGKALVDHWSWAASKGIMNKNTAGSLGAACSQVIKALDNWETVDVSKINPDDVISRFKNLRKQDFKPESLQTYETRFKKALASYLAYVRDPGAWRPVTQTRTPRAAKPSTSMSASNASPKIQEAAHTAHPNVPRLEVTRDDLGDYNFPIRRNLSARLILPKDLTEAEAKKLQAFIALLVVDSESIGKEGK